MPSGFDEITMSRMTVLTGKPCMTQAGPCLLRPG